MDAVNSSQEQERDWMKVRDWERVWDSKRVQELEWILDLRHNLDRLLERDSSAFIGVRERWVSAVFLDTVWSLEGWSSRSSVSRGLSAPMPC
ncbi:hypothetical protein MRX96_006236 [Rhipicephalus microplus]